MDHFLKSVANHLFQNYRQNFKEIVLVFPNHRSGVFFFNELKKLIEEQPVWSPSIITINEFMLNNSNLELGNSIQLLSELYVEYKKMSGSTESFDDFYAWGELLLADFNDVDKYLVDAELVFVNVKNFKSIENQIDFLSKDQIDVLKRFFNVFDAEKTTKLKDEFLRIWEIMLPLYKQFKIKLTAKKIGFEGMIYQDALAKIRQQKIEDYKFTNIFFIGFNAITPAEEEVFSVLMNMGLAQFFWDFDELYINNKAMEAGLFQRKFIQKFPPVDFNKNNNQLQGKIIKIIAASTDQGQVFSTSQILNTLQSQNHSETAIVLSNEQLLLPVINCIPDGITDINITMGYPLMDSLTGNFVDLVMQLHQNIRKSDIHVVSFYHKQVISLLRHPFIQQLSADASFQITEKISTENLYYLPINELQKEGILKYLFQDTDSTIHFAQYLESLLQFTFEQLYFIDNIAQRFLLEREFLFKLHMEIKMLNIQLAELQLNLQLPTYFKLVRKIMQSMRIPFEGEPILGLQIMGFLETRNLDFKNVIILSVNEGVIPAQGKTSSFIPFSLRKGFGLPTSELNDAMYAYYFYRLLQSAENVWLLYNSGSSGMSTGEKSRLIYQLEYDENFLVEKEVVNQSIEVISNRIIEIKKDGKIWNRMTEFIQEDKPRMLSPSAISIYLQCPLRFYFKSIAKVREVDEIDEVVDARLFGNIFHKAAEEIYSVFLKENTLVTHNLLTQLLMDDKRIDEIIRASFAVAFFGENTTRKFPIEGKNQIIFDVIKKYIMRLMEKDMEHAPFSIIGLEKKASVLFQVQVNGKKVNLNIGGTIDRLDRSERGLRVIDYKTGSDRLTFGDLADVFDSEKIKDTKAIFQTFIYSYIISKEIESETIILPMVYQVKQLFEENSSFQISSKKCEAFQTGNFLKIKEEVEPYLQNILHDLFNQKQPFVQTNNLKSCETCPYKNMCGR